MLLKLVLPTIKNQIIKEAKIVQWYKKPTDWIDYGDDLCQILIQREAKNILVKNILLNPSQKKNLVDKTKKIFDKLIVISSSDIGFLRSINTPAGVYIENGDLLGLVTTEADESFDILAFIKYLGLLNFYNSCFCN